MPSNRRRSVAALVVAFLLVTLVAPPAQADGRGETRWTFWWSWFVTGTSGFAARTFGYSGAVDPDGRVTTPPVPPEEAATLRYSLIVDPDGRVLAPEPPPVPAAGLAGTDEQ